MTTAILLALLLSHPNTQCTKAQARVVVKAAKKAGQRYDVPASLLLSVVIAETGCSNVVATGRGKGRLGCDVGYGQIHIPRCEQRQVVSMLDPYKNLLAAAKILDFSRSHCSRVKPAPHRACRRSQWAMYNPGSSHWSKRVLKIWMKTR